MVASTGFEGGSAVWDRIQRFSGGMIQWPKRVVFGADDADATMQQKLLEHLRRGLLIDFRAIAPPESAEQKALYQQALQRLDGKCTTWSDVYEAYRIKAHVLPDALLEPHLAREIEEAKRFGLETARVARAVQPEQSPDPAILRAHLVQLVSDVHCERKYRYMSRELRGEYVSKVCRLTWIVGAVFTLALVILLVGNSSFGGTHEETAGFTVSLAQLWPIETSYPGLFATVAAGLLGAWFSMLVSADKRLSGLSLEELRVAQRPSTLSARLCFGAASSVVFYFLMQSGMFTAAILPDIREVGFDTAQSFDPSDVPLRERALDGTISSTESLVFPKSDLCLLIIWGVICGFSEKFIPTALSLHTEPDDGAEPV